MTWTDFAYARQHLAEERVGRRVREAEADEDEAFNRAAKYAMKG